MRLKKGDKVEVMNKNDSPVSWGVAKIMSSNGHTYRVHRGQAVETVSRKLVRPSPPLVQGVENYTSGDIVEVFYGCAWRMAAVLRALEGQKETNNRYLVRLLGCSREIAVDESNIRMRQIWKDGKWDLIEKSSPEQDEDGIPSNPSTSIYQNKMNFRTPQINTRAKKEPRDDNMNTQDEASRSLKRMTPYGSSTIEAQFQVKRIRPIEKDGRKQKQKVDAVPYPREILGEKNMHASFNSSDSDACSVGSCSVTVRSRNNFCIPFIPFSCQESDSSCSDAESCYCPGSERKSSAFPLKEEVEGSIRNLELHAYRRTLEALYTSGPISWEQEAMLTNLRIMLRISNDEHLMELKSLVSTKTAINFR